MMLESNLNCCTGYRGSAISSVYTPVAAYGLYLGQDTVMATLAEAKDALNGEEVLYVLVYYFLL